VKKGIVGVLVLALVVLAAGGAAFAANSRIEEKTAIIESKVREGLVSEKAAEGFLRELQERMDACETDGTCLGPDANRERLGQKYSMGFQFGRNSSGMNGQNNGGNGFGAQS
jgi:hypothetical protein